MNAPKDILYIIPRPEIGGAERQLLMLMRGLDRTQFTPHVICLDGDGSLIDGYREAAETCRVLNRQRAFDREAIRTLTEEMKGLEPALVHTWLYIANLYGSVAARRAGISPLIVSQRGLGIDPQHSWLKVRQMRLFNRFIAHRADRLLVNARAVAKPMYDVGFTPEQTRVIYNGLNLDIEIKSEQQTALRAELGIQPTDILLAAIARIDPKKIWKPCSTPLPVWAKTNPGRVCSSPGVDFQSIRKSSNSWQTGSTYAPACPFWASATIRKPSCRCAIFRSYRHSPRDCPTPFWNRWPSANPLWQPPSAACPN